jgi:hypothetical protein
VETAALPGIADENAAAACVTLPRMVFRAVLFGCDPTINFANTNGNSSLRRHHSGLLHRPMRASMAKAGWQRHPKPDSFGIIVRLARIARCKLCAALRLQE